MLFSMWRIETQLDDAGAPYDRRAAVYDRLVRSRAYNRLAWSTSPADYTAFAARAFASDHGPLLEAAAGSAAATAELHARAGRPTMLVDLSRAMLDRAASGVEPPPTTARSPRTSVSCRPTCSTSTSRRTASPLSSASG